MAPPCQASRCSDLAGPRLEEPPRVLRSPQLEEARTHTQSLEDLLGSPRPLTMPLPDATTTMALTFRATPAASLAEDGPKTFTVAPRVQPMCWLTLRTTVAPQPPSPPLAGALPCAWPSCGLCRAFLVIDVVSLPPHDHVETNWSQDKP
jgi:hypothetical protein